MIAPASWTTSHATSSSAARYSTDEETRFRSAPEINRRPPIELRGTSSPEVGRDPPASPAASPTSAPRGVRFWPKPRVGIRNHAGESRGIESRIFISVLYICDDRLDVAALFVLEWVPDRALNSALSRCSPSLSPPLPPSPPFALPPCPVP